MESMKASARPYWHEASAQVVHPWSWPCQPHTAHTSRQCGNRKWGYCRLTGNVKYAVHLFCRCTSDITLKYKISPLKYVLHINLKIASGLSLNNWTQKSSQLMCPFSLGSIQETRSTDKMVQPSFNVCNIIFPLSLFPSSHAEITFGVKLPITPPFSQPSPHFLCSKSLSFRMIRIQSSEVLQLPKCFVNQCTKMHGANRHPSDSDTPLTTS